MDAADDYVHLVLGKMTSRTFFWGTQNLKDSRHFASVADGPGVANATLVHGRSPGVLMYGLSFTKAGLYTITVILQQEVCTMHCCLSVSECVNDVLQHGHFCFNCLLASIVTVL